MKLASLRLRECLEPWFSEPSELTAVCDHLAEMPEQAQRLVTTTVETLARADESLPALFAAQAPTAIHRLGVDGCEDWVQTAIDRFFDQGLDAARECFENLNYFSRRQRQQTRGLKLGEIRSRLGYFLNGLLGRRLAIEIGDPWMTDGETLFLPEVIDEAADTVGNFDCYRAIAVHLWSQCWYGTWRADSIEQIPRREPMLQTFHYLETLRLNACLARDFPGLRRALDRFHEPGPEIWQSIEAELADPASTVRDAIRLSQECWDLPRPTPALYQGKLDPDRVQARLKIRLVEEKRRLQALLATQQDGRNRAENLAPPVSDGDRSAAEGRRLSTRADNTTSDEVRELLQSIRQDLGEVPMSYYEIGEATAFDYDSNAPAVPVSGDGAASDDRAAFVYAEWDCTRLAHRKHWCRVYEREIEADYESDFVEQTLQNYRGQIKSLRRSFEVLRDEYRILKRQPHGENLDLDAIVEAIADRRSGREMSDRIYRKAHRVERNIAVVFMVDMSGSTQGWINQAQREALVLLAEALQTLDDRYAIYGFSGSTRKNCELYRIKTFDETYGAETRARIAAIKPQAYTRMGASIRHLSHLLERVNARSKLLITLSDGKPDDYDRYHGEYGVEDTRMALFEARHAGIHPFCITIDEQARDYLPHMYGEDSFVLIDDVAKLPYRISEIYRSLTS